MNTFDYMLIIMWVLIFIRFILSAVMAAKMYSDIGFQIWAQQNMFGKLEWLLLFIPLIVSYRLWG